MSELNKRVLWTFAGLVVTIPAGYIGRVALAQWAILDPFAKWLGDWLKVHVSAAQAEWTVAAIAVLAIYGVFLWLTWHRFSRPLKPQMGAVLARNISDDVAEASTESPTADWRPISEAIEHVADALGEARADKLFPQARAAIRQQAADGNLHLRGRAELKEGRGKFDPLMRNIPKSYWKQGFELNFLSTDITYKEHDHTWCPSDIAMRPRYWAIVADWKEYTSLWPKRFKKVTIDLKVSEPTPNLTANDTNEFIKIKEAAVEAITRIDGTGLASELMVIGRSPNGILRLMMGQLISSGHAWGFRWPKFSDFVHLDKKVFAGLSVINDRGDMGIPDSDEPLITGLYVKRASLDAYVKQVCDAPSAMPVKRTHDAADPVRSLLSGNWIFEYSPASVTGRKALTFNADGTIGAGRNQNEDSWEMETSGTLAIWRRDGSLQNRFRYEDGTDSFVCTNDAKAVGIKDQTIYRPISQPLVSG